MIPILTADRHYNYHYFTNMTDEAPKPHKRRVRYSGTHPRRFDQKYKELDPAKYAEQIEHIIAKGLTPAGTHRPICVDEILKILAPKPGETAFDATLGYGGHTRKLLEKLLPGGRLFAVDVDTVELLGAERLIYARLGDEPLIVRVEEGASAPLPGSTLRVRPREDRLHWFDASTGKRL